MSSIKVQVSDLNQGAIDLPGNYANTNTDMWRGTQEIIGLDPVFGCTMKVYIKDVHNFQTKTSVDFKDKDIFCFRDRIVNRIEVMGVVIRVDKRDRVHSYTVDDGTGVITCTCWINSPREEPMQEGLPLSLQEKFKELLPCGRAQENEEIGYSLGDLLLVRGWITVYRGVKEITAMDHRKIDNPCREMERVLEMPSLYSVYDKPFFPPQAVAEELKGLDVEQDTFNKYSVQNVLVKCFKDYQGQEHVIHLNDIMSWPLVRELLPSAQDDHLTWTTDHRKVLESVLEHMQANKGLVYKRTDLKNVYEIIKADCPLALYVMEILRNACLTGKNADSGCHTNHVQHRLEKSQAYKDIQDSVVFFCIQCLEENSDLICMESYRYLPIS